MGRVEVLRESLEPSVMEAVEALIKLAKEELESGFIKSAADLLRASEHLSFAVLVDDRRADVSMKLEESIKEHFDELLRKADDHWEGLEKQSSILTVLYKSTRQSAAKALGAKAYRRALEFARAAEALAHVRRDDQRKLGIRVKKLQLGGA